MTHRKNKGTSLVRTRKESVDGPIYGYPKGTNGVEGTGT